MLTASYTWMRGYAYEFLAILHAATVIVTLLWLPFGKLFHVFQRPAQLGVGFYKDAGARDQQAACRRCGQPYASQLMVRDLTTSSRNSAFATSCRRRPLPGRLPQVPPRALRSGAGSVVAAIPERTRQGSRVAEVPVDPLRIIERFGPHLSAMTGAAVDQRRARSAREDALLLLRAAVRDSAQGPRQRGDWLRAVGGLPVQSRHAVPEGREALPAGLASRPADDGAAAGYVVGVGIQPAAVRRPSAASPPRSAAFSRPTAPAPSASSAAPA